MYCHTCIDHQVECVLTLLLCVDSFVTSAKHSLVLISRIISSTNLNKKRPDLFDTLISGDIIEVLNQHKGKVDLLVASDTFIYFNDVNNLFSAIHDSLKYGGYAVFSLENVSVDNEQRCV